MEEVRAKIDSEVQHVRTYVDDIKQVILKDMSKQVVSVVGKVEKTLVAYEIKVDENLKSVIAHISEEISTMVVEEADKRTVAIQDAEKKFKKLLTISLQRARHCERKCFSLLKQLLKE